MKRRIKGSRTDFGMMGVSGQEIEDFLDSIDMDKAEELNRQMEGGPITPESLAWFETQVRFDGSYEKHIAWIEKNGSETQKREDIPLLREMMEKEKSGKCAL